MKDFFELGRVLKPQGVKGEIKAELYTDNLDRVYDLPYVLTGTAPDFTKHEVASARTDGRFAYLALKDIQSRDEAEALRGNVLFIDRANAAQLPEGAFYIDDLLGLEVMTDAGRTLGKLRDIMQTGAADIYVVSREDGSELLFPAAEGVFVERNPKDGRIVLDAARLSEVAEV